MAKEDFSARRAESNFFDDIRNHLYAIVSKDLVRENYLILGLPNAANYPVDFYIEGHKKPLYPERHQCCFDSRSHSGTRNDEGEALRS
ncbi:hypothetical protein [Cupriavidus plantarum]|uniref:hypothetical protein n=1 Tax=Cupriavidus plantarum TaxID=942865 RepID=UPI000E228C0E|nr:hypothetical protein [Cupriavidus plantarum]REF02456.1 hypothetical protein C7418_1265 [Cupriavidus plantarum]